MKRFLLGLAACAASLPALSGVALAQRVNVTDLTNVAAAANGGRVLESTSTFNDDKAYNASNLIDGQVWTTNTPTASKGWASNRYDPVTMDAVTFGFRDNKLVQLGKIVLNPATDLPAERWAKDVEVQVSTDSAEGPFNTAAILTLRQEARPQSFDILPVQARFVRLVFRSNYGSDRATALGEVEMYEAIDNKDPMGALIGRLESAINDLTRYRQVQLEGGNGGGQVQGASTSGKKSGLSAATLQTIQLLGEGETRVPVGKTNIASSKNGGKVVAYSSTFDNDAKFSPNNLIDSDNFREADGKGSFGWASQGFEPGKEYVTLGFAGDRTKLIGKIVMNPVSNQSDLRWARRVEVQTTLGDPKDGPWKTAATINLQPRGVNQEFLLRPAEAKYVRFIFRANGPGVVLPNADPNVNSDRAVSLGEIEIYEAATNDDQLGTLIKNFTSVLVDLKALRAANLRNADAPDAGGADLAPASLKKNGATQPRKPATSAKSKSTPVRPRRGQLQEANTLRTRKVA